MRIAVVGAGVAGLVAARALHHDHDVSVFEQHERPGGHAHTIAVDTADGTLALDTGFLVYNERTYPLFSRLLGELGVVTQPSDMSFGVRCLRCGIEYSSRGLAGLAGRRRQLFQPDFHRLLLGIVRFNRWARSELARRRDLPDTLAAAVAARGLPPTVLRHYLIPMTSAIWSSTGAAAAAFPLRPFLAFFDNHGLLRLTGHPVWRSIVGGSREYVRALVQPFATRVRTGQPVRAIHRTADGVVVSLAGGERMPFDRVIVATHADEALALLADADDHEAAALGGIPYRHNDALLHTDARVLPRARGARAAWNCLVEDCRDGASPVRITYDLNRLQRLQARETYCVTLNDAGLVDPARVIARLRYAHPVYSVEGIAARERLAALNGRRRTVFCGAYLGHGFHEDGVRSGLEGAALVRARAEAA